MASSLAQKCMKKLDRHAPAAVEIRHRVSLERAAGPANVLEVPAEMGAEDFS